MPEEREEYTTTTHDLFDDDTYAKIGVGGDLAELIDSGRERLRKRGLVAPEPNEQDRLDGASKRRLELQLQSARAWKSEAELAETEQERAWHDAPLSARLELLKRQVDEFITRWEPVLKRLEAERA